MRPPPTWWCGAPPVSDSAATTVTPGFSHSYSLSSFGVGGHADENSVGPGYPTFGNSQMLNFINLHEVGKLYFLSLANFEFNV